jgi:hypothetical protein
MALGLCDEVVEPRKLNEQSVVGEAPVPRPAREHEGDRCGRDLCAGQALQGAQGGG